LIIASDTVIPYVHINILKFVKICEFFPKRILCIITRAEELWLAEINIPHNVFLHIFDKVG